MVKKGDRILGGRTMENSCKRLLIDNEMLIRQIHWYGIRNDAGFIDGGSSSHETKIIVSRHDFSSIGDYGLHWHDCFEMELMVSGSGEETINGRKYHVGPGDIVMMAPTDCHSYHMREKGVLYNVMFHGSLIHDDAFIGLLEPGNDGVIHLEEREFAKMKQLMEIAMLEYDPKSASITPLMYKLLECILSVYMKNRAAAIGTSKASSRSAAVKQAILYLHTHFFENPSLEKTASRIFICPGYLSTLFHSETGLTYKQYLMNIRLEFARRIIVSSDMPINEICTLAGFTSYPYFLKTFKSVYNVTPSALRVDSSFC